MQIDGESDRKLSHEIIKNNTDAIKEMSRSNDNVANAINLFKSALETNINALDKHDTRAAHMEVALTRIDERTDACLKRRSD
jgi:hypothetical protein